MFRKISCGFILLIMLGLLAGCVEIEVTTSGALEYKEYDEQAFDPAASISLINGNGSVAIEPSTDGKIKVQSVKILRGESEQRLREIAGYLTISSERSGNAFHIETHYPVPRPAGVSSMGVDYRVYIPANARVKVKTSNGSIVVNGIKNTVELQSSNGSLTVTNHRGFLDGLTSNGSIEVIGGEGEVDLQTSNGRISIRNYTGAVEANSSNGRIEVDTTKVIQRAELETSNSSIFFKARLDRRGDYDLKSSNGSIEMWLEKSLNYDLYAKTSNGRVQFTFPIQFSGTFEKNLVDGKLFNGIDVGLTARTSNGNIIFNAWEDK